MNELALLLIQLENHNTSSDVLCDTARALLIMGDMRAIEPILDRLKGVNDPPCVRRELYTALAGIMQSNEHLNAEVVETMVSALFLEKADEVRESVVSALGILGISQASEILISILQSAILRENLSLIFACVDALSRIKEIRAINIFLQILDSDLPMVKVFTAEALGRFGPAAKESLPNLRKLSEEGNHAEREMALEAISLIESDTE